MDALATFIISAVLLTLAPGPDILFVTTKSIATGTRAGIVVALGLVTGTFFHTVLAAFGISLLIRESVAAFACVKWLGIAYLAYLGIQAFRHRNDIIIKENSSAGISSQSAKSLPLKKLYFTGVFMAALNPKLILFFLAFLPQFVPAGTPYAGREMLILGAIFAIQAFAIFSIVATFAGTVSKTLREKPAISRWLNITTSLVLFGIAVAVAFA